MDETIQTIYTNYQRLINRKLGVCTKSIRFITKNINWLIAEQALDK